MQTLILTVISAFGTFGLKLIMSISTEKYIAKSFFYIAELLAKKSGNGITFDIVEQLKAAYYDTGK